MENENPNSKYRILVVDDQLSMRLVYQDIIQFEGYRTEMAEDGKEGLEKYMAAERGGDWFDAVVTDLRMPNMDGEGLLQNIIKYDPAALVYITTADADKQPLVEQLLKLGAKQVLLKGKFGELISGLRHDLKEV